jgi:hypothetical protein
LGAVFALWNESARICFKQKVEQITQITNRIVALMNRDMLLDEVRRIECEVVEGERQLAEQEARVIALARQNQDTSRARSALELMREDQRSRDQDRQRLLSMLQR